MSSTYLTRTITTSTDNTKFTISVWVRRGSLTSSTYHNIINSQQSGTTSGLGLWFGNDNNLYFNFGTSTTTSVECKSTATFRDTNGWYHIVVAGDASQSGTDKLKFWVNGEQITSFSSDNRSSFATLAYDLGDTTYPTIIGRKHDGTFTFDGRMAHFHFIDGTAYAASTFGSTDSTTGIWKPNTLPSVTYGNNGFFLKFNSSGAMGADSSGNANNFTVNGTMTQTQDTPQNVFPILNWLAGGTDNSGAISSGGSVITGGNDIPTTYGVTKGKWYWEIKRGNSVNSWHVGICSTNEGFNRNGNQLLGGEAAPGGIGGSYFVRNDNSNNVIYEGGGLSSGSATGSPGTIASGDIMGFALDLDSGTKQLTYYRNGSSVCSVTFTYDGENPVYPYVRCNTGAIAQINMGDGYFGSTAVTSGNADEAGYGIFEYAPPSGYYSLCSKNINTYG